MVDDSAFMRAVLKDILIANGFSRVYQAGDGSEGAAMSARWRPDITTMDVAMPGTDGLHALKTILAEDPEAKVIMVTASHDESLAQEAMRLGAKAYITKPFDPSTISRTLARVLEQAMK